MADELKSIDFKQAAEYPGAQALRVVRSKGASSLVISQTTSTPPMGAQTVFLALQAGNPGAGWMNVAVVSEMVPAQPAWDAAADSRGSFQIVYERPGGAINALLLRAPSGETRTLSGQYPMKSFSLPRFSKASGEPPQWLTAIVDNRICVVFSLTAAGPYHELGECAEGLLVKHGAGFVFLSKKTIPGTVRGNDISLGQLRATALGMDLKPAGKTVDVASGAVFQFDADTVGGKLVVVATAPGGIVIASSATRELRFVRKQYANQAPLTFPGLQPGAAGNAIVGVLDGSDSGKVRILAAEIPVP